jgi:hypothetical protein
MSSHHDGSPASISTPEVVETSGGTLRFTDGIPDTGTCDTVYDHLDLRYGVDAHLAGLRGGSPGVAEGNWIQTVPGKGRSTILRLYSPEQPFFDRSWRPSDIGPAA